MKTQTVYTASIKYVFLVFALISNIPLLSNPGPQSSDKWIYSVKFKSTDTTLIKSNKSIFIGVTFICSNQKDSIKIIHAELASNINNTNRWHFQNGSINSYDKFGLVTVSNFKEYEITAFPDSSLKTKNAFVK
jgi:hypothetical protein